MPKRANCFARAQDLKAGALCEFEYEPREYERRAWRGGAASGEGQRADLWPSLVGAVLKTAFRGGAPRKTLRNTPPYFLALATAKKNEISVNLYFFAIVNALSSNLFL